MPRSKLIRTHLYPYHVTIRTNNKEWFDIPLSKVWSFCLDSLKEANEFHPIHLVSFVLMSNHYHMILKTPDSNLDQFMYEFNKRLSLRVRKKSQRINSIFGGRYKWCLIKNQTYLYNCYRYVYQNPLRAGVTTNVANYPYSSLYYLVHGKKFPLMLIDSFGFKDHFALTWLNKTIDEVEISGIRNGLQFSSLDDLKSRTTRKSLTHLSYQKSPGTN